MNQRVLAAKQFAKNQAKKVTEYFKPTEKVRARDVVREMPKAIGQVFSGTRDFVNTSGKIMGEGLAYATDSNVRDQYKKGNTNILPTISNPTAGRQLWGNAAKSFGEVATAGKIPGLSKMAMSAKVLPRALAGGTMGYGYGVADELSRPEAVSKNTFVGVTPIMSALGGALFGGMSKPAAKMAGEMGQEVGKFGDDIRTINPANRVTHKIVDKYDMEPVPGVFAPGGIQQQRPIMESFRKEVETTQNPYNPQSSIARVLLGKQPVGMSIKAVDDPLLQEARKGEYLYHGTGGTSAESIIKDGLKPGRRGQLSLSKDEAYAKGYAQDGMTPQGKTEGTMFRVKADFLKGKTTTKRLDGKPRPASDELNELLTKENIPPESLEVFKNGKWQPLKENPLLSEARKYGSAEEYVKAQQGFFRGESSKEFGKYIKLNKDGVPTTLGGNHGIPTSKDASYVNKRFVGSSGELGVYTPKGEVKILSDPNEIAKMAGKKTASDVYHGGKVPAFERGILYRNAKKAGYDAVDLTETEKIARATAPQNVHYLGNPEQEVRIINQDAFNLKTKSQLTDLYNQATKK